jgi:CTP:molybdopterin cytidylyltransferase MocA
MTSRLLIVPAAGLGTRLGADRPKLLVPVAGMPMIDRLLALFERTVDRAVVIVHPSFSDRVGEHLQRATLPVTIEVQHEPTGMLDAIALADRAVRDAQPDEVWIVWCDQVAIHPATIARLAQTMAASPNAVLAMPTVEHLDLLPAYAREVSIGTTTGERNFLPFIAWLAASAGRRGHVVTFPAVDDMEAVGVNTPEELQRVERYLIARESTVR